MRCLTRKQECERIIRQFGADEAPSKGQSSADEALSKGQSSADEAPSRGQSRTIGPIMAMLERQFVVLHNRTQVMLGLCGVVITTTGFSGRIIAGTNFAAQLLIVNGIALVLLAAVVVVWSVLHLRWLTQQPGEDIQAWLMTALAYRDRKTEAYRVGIALLLVGLTLYVIAIGIMLLNPERNAVILNR